jgi:hypothetical protein
MIDRKITIIILVVALAACAESSLKYPPIEKHGTPPCVLVQVSWNIEKTWHMDRTYAVFYSPYRAKKDCELIKKRFDESGDEGGTLFTRCECDGIIDDV